MTPPGVVGRRLSRCISTPLPRVPPSGLVPGDLANLGPTGGELPRRRFPRWLGAGALVHCVRRQKRPFHQHNRFGHPDRSVSTARWLEAIFVEASAYGEGTFSWDGTGRRVATWASSNSARRDRVDAQLH